MKKDTTYNLFEDNRSIESIFKYLERKVVEIRKKGILEKYPLIKQKIEELYNEDILPWMEEYYMLNIEPTKNYESKMVDSILDLISILDKLK